MNIAQHIERASRQTPEQIALVFEERSSTYRDLNVSANRMANLLRGLGIGLGDRVALLLPNTPAFVIAYLGAMKIGAIAVTLNVMLKPAELTVMLIDCGAPLLITTAELAAGLQRDKLPALRQVVIAEGDPGADASLDELLSQNSAEAEAIELTVNTPAVIVYTSGTTGGPKGAVLSHGNVIANMQAKNDYLGTQSDDRLLLFLPLFHCFGQNAILNNALNAGATVVLQRRFDPTLAIEAVIRERITMFNAVPTVYARLLALKTDIRALATVRLFLSAGAPMSATLAQHWWQVYGKPIHEGYGLTESSPFATYNHHQRYKLGSVGTPIAGVDIRIVDAEGNDLPPGERGEILIRGHNVMLGYWNRPEATAQAIRDGWLHTGDIGLRDDEGYLFVVDRLKDVVIVAGFNVYPTEVEDVLYGHPAVAEAAIYGVPDEIQGEIVKAKIVVKPGHAVSAEELRLFCRERLANYKVPRLVEIVDSLPKNPTGKILKRVLRDTETSIQYT